MGIPGKMLLFLRTAASFPWGGEAAGLHGLQGGPRDELHPNSEWEDLVFRLST